MHKACVSIISTGFYAKQKSPRVITETTQILGLLYHDIGEKMKWEYSATNF